MGVTMNIPLSGVPHGAGSHDDTVQRFTEWNGYTWGVEFVATSAGIVVMELIHSGSSSRGSAAIDTDNLGSPIEYEHFQSTTANNLVITVPFDKGDGVLLTSAVYTTRIATVYYFA